MEITEEISHGKGCMQKIRPETGAMLLGAVLWLLVLGGCSRDTEKRGTGGPPPAPVVVAPVVQQNVTIYREHVARTEARETVEIRARVEGFLEKVLFREGSRVKAGQLIFIIDQRPSRMPGGSWPRPRPLLARLTKT